MDARIDATLDRLGIAHLADREPFALSGGEQQRVAIASIVAMGTTVLVLDEPTAQLDPAGTDRGGRPARGPGTRRVRDPVRRARSERPRPDGPGLVLDSGRVVALDVPGSALAAAAGVADLAPPTLVRLARTASIDLAHGLRRVGGRCGPAVARSRARGSRSAPPPPLAGDDRPAPAWTPRPDRPPVRVAVDGLVHRYPNGVEAVRGVTLTIEPGEAVAILGQNGSGKTTLVKHLNGLLRPAEGRVTCSTVNPRRADRWRTWRAPSASSSRTRTSSSSSGRSSARSRSARGTSVVAAADIDALVAASLEAVGLADERSTNPYDLDLSRRKLVALAGVLAMDPAVLVLDEPTTGQDADGVARVGAIVEAFRAAGRSVVTITHDMEFAATHFTRIVVMRAGEVVADGPPEVVFAAAGCGSPRVDRVDAAAGRPVAVRMGLATICLDAPHLLAALRR